MKKLLIVLGAALLFGACGLPTPDEYSVSFSLPAVNEADFDSADYKGTPVLMGFMGTHCGYCQMSIPMLNAVQEKYGDSVKVVGVYGDPAPENLKKYMTANGVKYTVLYNGGELFDEVGVQGIPHFILLNAKHLPVKEWRGFSQHDFEAHIERNL